MEITKQQLDAMFRALVPGLEEDIARLRTFVAASDPRIAFWIGDCAHELGIRERALASIRRDHF